MLAIFRMFGMMRVLREYICIFFMCLVSLMMCIICISFTVMSGCVVCASCLSSLCLLRVDAWMVLYVLVRDVLYQCVKVLYTYTGITCALHTLVTGLSLFWTSPTRPGNSCVSNLARTVTDKSYYKTVLDRALLLIQNSQLPYI